MKKQKTFYGLALLGLVLVLGIGYAAVTTNLFINGTASYSGELGDFTVVYDVDSTPTTSGANVTAAYTDATHATMAVTGLSAVGDSATATFTVENNSSSLDAEVYLKEVENNNSNFKIALDWTETDKEEIAAGASSDVTATVTVVSQPVTEADRNATFTVTLNADAVNE